MPESDQSSTPLAGRQSGGHPTPAGRTLGGKSFWSIWFPLYLFVVGFVVAGLVYGRGRALEVYGTVEAEADWKEWVEDVKQQDPNAGPVARRPPAAPGPPALILMRDHFATCLTLALLITSAAYWTTAFLLHGTLTTPAQGDGVKG